MSAAPATLPVPSPVRTLTLPQDRWLGEDKLKHFAFSFAITAGVAGAARTVTGSHESMLAGAAVGAAAGIAKEIYDRKSGGSASLRDLFWDVAGVGAAVLVAQQAK